MCCCLADFVDDSTGRDSDHDRQRFQAVVNLDGAVGSNPAGMYQWTVTGLSTGQANQLNQQWFWYGIDGGSVQPINSIGTAVYTQPSANQLSATYANSQLSVTVNYLLTGGGSARPIFRRELQVEMFPGTPLDLHFYQYSDFNLLNDPLEDSVSMNNNFVIQWKNDTQIQEAIIAPDADHFEANTTPARAAPSPSSIAVRL